MFDSSDSKKNLDIFCCSANSTYGPSRSSFELNSWSSTMPCYSWKVQASTSLNCILLMDPGNKLGWLGNYTLFINELFIDFGPYDMMENVKIELEQLVMKDSHNVTQVFCWISLTHLTSTLLQYNDKALYWRHTSLFQEDQEWNGALWETLLAQQTLRPHSKDFPALLGAQVRLLWEASLAPKQEANNDW